jgi:hypothetical protein
MHVERSGNLLSSSLFALLKRSAFDDVPKGLERFEMQSPYPAIRFLKEPIP